MRRDAGKGEKVGEIVCSVGAIAALRPIAKEVGKPAPAAASTPAGRAGAAAAAAESAEAQIRVEATSLSLLKGVKVGKKATALLSVTVPGERKPARSAAVELKEAGTALAPNGKKCVFELKKTFSAAPGSGVAVALGAALLSKEDYDDSEVRFAVLATDKDGKQGRCRASRARH